MEKSKVFIVDDNPMVRESLTKLINHESDLVVCDEADGGHEALRKLTQSRPDVITVDLGLQDMHGLDLIRMIKNQNSAAKILVMSMHDESIYGERAFDAGACGYLMKHYSVNQILEALRVILSGRQYMSSQLARQIRGEDGEPSRDRDAAFE